MVCGYQQSNLYMPSLSEPYYSGEATFQKHRFSYLQTRHEPMLWTLTKYIPSGCSILLTNYTQWPLVEALTGLPFYFLVYICGELLTSEKCTCLTEFSADNKQYLVFYMTIPTLTRAISNMFSRSFNIWAKILRFIPKDSCQSPKHTVYVKTSTLLGG